MFKKQTIKMSLLLFSSVFTLFNCTNIPITSIRSIESKSIYDIKGKLIASGGIKNKNTNTFNIKSESCYGNAYFMSTGNPEGCTQYFEIKQNGVILLNAINPPVNQVYSAPVGCGCGDFNVEITMTLSGSCGNPNGVYYLGGGSFNVACPTPTPNSTITPTPTPTATPTPFPSVFPPPPDGGSGNSNNDPLIYPPPHNNGETSQNCPSMLTPEFKKKFDEDYKNNDKAKQKAIETFLSQFSSTVVGVYDFDSGANKPNLTFVLRPNGTYPNGGSFSASSNMPVLDNNLKNTQIYTVDSKGNKNSGNLLITPSTQLPNNEPKVLSRDSLTTVIELATSNINNNLNRRSLESIKNDFISDPVKQKIISDLDSNTTNILKNVGNMKAEQNNKTFYSIDSKGVSLTTNNGTQCCVDYTHKQGQSSNNHILSLPVLAVNLNSISSNMTVGQTTTLIIENGGMRIPMKLEFKGNNGNDPVWSISCGG